MNVLARSTTLIANKTLKFRGRTYSPGDKFDYQRMGHAQRRKVTRLIDGPERKIVELTAESMAKALRFRDKPYPPRGFTLAGLIALGYLTEEQIAEQGWNTEDRDRLVDVSAPWAPPEGSWQVRPDPVEGVTHDAQDVVWIVPFYTAGKPGKAGVVRYFVHNVDGENLNGDVSINGKVKATEWAQEHLAKVAAARTAGQDQDWSTYPENPDDWSDEQVAVFDHWFEGVEEDEEPEIEHPAVAKLFTERRAAPTEDPVEDANADFFNMKDAEARDFIDTMSDDDLVALVVAITDKPADEVKEIARVVMAQMAIDAHTEKAKAKEPEDGGDIPA